VYSGLPATNVAIAMAIAAAGMAKPTAQLMFSCTHTITVTASRLPMLTKK
jgi:hypothetical protein